MIRDYLEWVYTNGGASFIRDGYALLSPDEQRLIALDRPGLGVIASDWYSQTMVTKLTEPFWIALSVPARRTGLRQVARYVVDQSLRGVQKVLFNLLVTPERAARHMNTLWSKQYDKGKVEWDVRKPGEMHVVLSDFRSHTPCCRNVKAVRTRCVHHGARQCESFTTWTP